MNHILYTVLGLKPTLLRYILVDITIQSRGRQPRDSTPWWSTGCFFVGCLQEPCPQLRHSMPQQLLHRSLTLCSEPLGKVLWTIDAIDFGCLCWNSSVGGRLPNLKQKIRGKSAVAFCSTDGWIPWALKTAMNGVTELLRGNISDILNVGIPAIKHVSHCCYSHLGALDGHFHWSK